jgi:hypothetical protein
MMLVWRQTVSSRCKLLQAKKNPPGWGSRGRGNRAGFRWMASLAGDDEVKNCLIPLEVVDAIMRTADSERSDVYR